MRESSAPYRRSRSLGREECVAAEGSDKRNAPMPHDAGAVRRHGERRASPSDAEAHGVVRQAFAYYEAPYAQTLIEFGVFAALRLIGFAGALTNACAAAVSASFSLAMNRNVAFRASNGSIRGMGALHRTLPIELRLLESRNRCAFVVAQHRSDGRQARRYGLPGRTGLFACRYVIFR